jgi:hypothetical protein
LIIGMVYVLARFNLYIVSPALDEKLSLGQSWRLTRGNGWRLVFVGLLLYAPFIVASLVLDYALSLHGTLTYAIATGVLSVLGILVTGFGSAIVYRAFVPAAADAGNLAEGPAH